MKVILLKPVPKLGHKGDVVSVKDGHAINYLIPQGFARMATATGVAILQAQKSSAQKKESREFQDYEKIKKQLEGKTLEIKANAHESGTLFASVHARDIIQAVKEQYHVDVPEVSFKEVPVMKKVGEYKVGVQLKDSKFQIKVSIVAHA